MLSAFGFSMTAFCSFVELYVASRKDIVVGQMGLESEAVVLDEDLKVAVRT
jgi:hypothetical protein